MGNNQELELWTSLNEKSRNIESKMNVLARKRTGSYYTDLQLTDVMMKELVQYMKKGEKRVVDYRFFEPCVGAGNFVFSYIKAVRDIGVNVKEAETLLDNIFKDIYRKDICVVLMHDSDYLGTTVEMLPELLKRLTEMDAVILPITENTTLIQHISADSVQ